jgi:pilus assembly protein CpaC
LVRVSVTNPDIASAVTVTERQVLIHGQQPGSVTLLLWNEQEQVQSFDLDVQLDVANARETLARLIPEEQIEIRQSGQALVLTGEVKSESQQQQAEAVAKTYASEVVNMLSIRENSAVVLLQVKIAEVDRSALNEFGISLFSTGAGNTIGATSTQQFGQLGAGVGQIPVRTRDPGLPNTAANAIGAANTGFGSVIGLSDLMNIFLFRPDLNLGTVIRALDQQSLLQILAEPNVLAMNGRQASFLAGGEFPFPVVQGGGAFQAVTIEFREFGVRVNFTPQIQNDEMIRLKVAPEVSALDFSNALTISGFIVPALTTRKAETEVELKNGQSFAIAGLIDNRLVEVVSKVPGLGDIPLLGRLFKSRSVNQANTELLVIVTPQLVSAVDPSQVPSLPFPASFLDTEGFDARWQPDEGQEAPDDQP